MKIQNVLKMNSVKKGLAVGAVTMILPVLALAQSGVGTPTDPPRIYGFGIQSIINILNLLVRWIFTIFLIIAVIFILLAAFNYLFSGGDPTKMKKATNQVVFAAVAIAVALLSVSIQFIVRQLLGVPPGLGA